MRIILMLSFAFYLIWSLEIVPSKHQLEYFNPKYMKYMNMSFLKRSRNTPYYVSLELETYVGVGNNLTLKMALFEELSSGNYQPTPIQGVFKLCDFLYNEPFFGQMYAKQLPANWSCPFPPGTYRFKDLVIHLENFPHRLPFSWSSFIMRTRVDVQGILTTTNEEAFKWKTFITVTQKLKKTGSTKKSQ